MADQTPPKPTLSERDYMIVSDLRSVRMAKDAIRGVITPEVDADYRIVMAALHRMEERLNALVMTAAGEEVAIVDASMFIHGTRLR